MAQNLSVLDPIAYNFLLEDRLWHSVLISNWNLVLWIRARMCEWLNEAPVNIA